MNESCRSRLYVELTDKFTILRPTMG